MSKALVILNELDNDDLNWLARVGQKKILSPGTVLIYEQQPISALYIILSGHFRVSVKAFNDQELAIIGRGEIVGEISFVDPRPPLATVTALEKSVVLAIPRVELGAKLQKNLGFASRFYRGISMCLADRMHNTVRRLGYQPGEEETELETEELSPALKENLALAEAKFNWLSVSIS